MKTYRANAGPFKERVYYSNEEIEDICIDELRAVSLFPNAPEAIRIDRFVEKRFKVTPKYEALPSGLLGFTKFSANGVEEIVVSKILADDGSKAAERRISTTLAHEAGHGLLHAHLFALECNAHSLPLFRENIDCNQQKILCRNGDDAISVQERGRPSGYDGRWWEYQANRIIGSLLLPRPLVYQALTSFIVKQGMLGIETVLPARRKEAIASLIDIFEVNPVVARLRLDEIFPMNNQLTL